MKGFFLGLLVAGLGIGGYFYWQRLQPKTAGPGLPAADAGASTNAKKTRRRSRGAARVARGLATGDTMAGAEPEPEPVHLSAADLRPVSQGDDLSKPDVLRLDMSNDKELPELLARSDRRALSRPRVRHPGLHRAGASGSGELCPRPRDHQVPHPARGHRARRARGRTRRAAAEWAFRLHQGRRRRYPFPGRRHEPDRQLPVHPKLSAVTRG